MDLVFRNTHLQHLLLVKTSQTDKSIDLVGHAGEPIHAKGPRVERAQKVTVLVAAVTNGV